MNDYPLCARSDPFMYKLFSKRSVCVAESMRKSFFNKGGISDILFLLCAIYLCRLRLPLLLSRPLHKYCFLSPNE